MRTILRGQTRRSGALAVPSALILLVLTNALLATLHGPPRASAQQPTLSGDLPTAGGIALAVWSGGHADDLLALAGDRGCNPRSVWANRPGGGLVGYFPTSIAIVNADFVSEYPGGQLAANSPVVLVCTASGPPTVPPGAQPVSLSAAFGGRGFDRPIELVPYTGGRWLVAEQDGRVLLLDSQGNELGTFVDQPVSRDGNEEGLLSVALDPSFPATPYVYLYYSASSGSRRTVLSRLTVSGDAALPSSELVLLEISQPFANHNGGAVRFGPDSMLYLSVGDGGSGGDPQGNGQNRSTLLGNVLRIDVSAANASTPYVIPSHNPFAAVSGVRGEIWAYGLRNPWRMAFDSATGALWLGDVGQGAIEEVDRIVRGGNYGWNRLEGNDCFEPPSGCNSAGTVAPVATYTHNRGCSVTGGVVYRGSAISHLAGHYLYGDFCSGRIWAVPVGGGSAVEIARSGSIASFATGPTGDVYVLTFGDGILRIVP